MNVKRIFTGITLSVLSLVIVLGLVEWGLQYISVVDNSYPESSWWYKAKWYDSHRKSSEKFSYAIDEYHPLYGWVLKAGLQNFPFSNYTVSSNQNQIRISGEAATGTAGIKILVLGDSFTFGECVNDSNTYPAYLQQLIAGSEVINAGVHGWGHDQMLLRLQQEGTRYKPDVVLLGCFNADLARNHLRFRDYAKPFYMLENDSLVLKGVPVPSPEQLLSDFRPKLFDLVSSKTAFLFDEVKAGDEDILSEEILVQLIRECRKLNAVPVFVYLPWKDECVTGRALPSRAFSKVCAKENVSFINPVDSIYSSIRNLVKPEDEFACHYTPKVNEVIARTIAAHLKQNKSFR